MAPHSASRKQVMRMLTKMRKMATGFQRNGNLLAKFEMLGRQVTPAQVLARLKPSLDAADQAETLKSQLKASLAARDESVLADQPYFAQVSISLVSTFGGRDPRLEYFGVPYEKPRKKRTAAEEAVSVALRKQTRQVRGTMGRKQRAAITSAGKPGVIVVDPSGKPIGGLPPVPPGKKPSK